MVRRARDGQKGVVRRGAGTESGENVSSSQDLDGAQTKSNFHRV